MRYHKTAKIGLKKKSQSATKMVTVSYTDQGISAGQILFHVLYLHGLTHWVLTTCLRQPLLSILFHRQEA